MVEIAEGVTFDTVAREWRCKWSPDGDKASLVAAQEALNAVISELKKLDGVKRVSFSINIMLYFCLSIYLCFFFCYVFVSAYILNKIV